MNIRLWKFSSVPAVALGAALLLSGCGSSGGGEGTASPSPSSSPVTATGSPSATKGTDANPTTAPATSAPAATEAAEPVEPLACSAADLAGSVENTPGGGAAGSVYRTLVLTNVSADPCIAAPGYPGVSYLNASGQQIGAAAARTGDGPAAAGPLLLEPGASAAAELRETRAELYGDECQPQQAAQLLVYPPDDTNSLTVAHEILACGNANIELLGVGTLQKR